jgi:hypothetical protein
MGPKLHPSVSSLQAVTAILAEEDTRLHPAFVSYGFRRRDL